jgi:hypothetical protein
MTVESAVFLGSDREVYRRGGGDIGGARCQGVRRTILECLVLFAE